MSLYDSKDNNTESPGSSQDFTIHSLSCQSSSACYRAIYVNESHATLQLGLERSSTAISLDTVEITVIFSLFVD